MPSMLFVHGLNSKCADAFPNMIDSFRNDRDFDGWTIDAYDYDTSLAIATNGGNLREQLKKYGGDLIIIAHSMGGLVARYACLTREAEPLVAKRLIMIGTPNFGALQSSQLSLMSQIIFH